MEIRKSYKSRVICMLEVVYFINFRFPVELEMMYDIYTSKT